MEKLESGVHVFFFGLICNRACFHENVHITDVKIPIFQVIYEPVDIRESSGDSMELLY